MPCVFPSLCITMDPGKRSPTSSSRFRDGAGRVDDTTDCMQSSRQRNPITMHALYVCSVETTRREHSQMLSHVMGRVRNALLARGQGCPIARTFPDLSIKTNTRRLLLRTLHPRCFTFACVDLSVRILYQVSGSYLLAGHDSPHRRDWILYSLARVLAVVVEPGWWWEQQAALLPCRRASALHACPCRPPGSPLSPALHSPEVQSLRRRLVAVKPTLRPSTASSALRCLCRPLRAASALPHYKLRPSLSDANLPRLYYSSPHLFIPTSPRATIHSPL
jgi:hypothetical protein